MIYDKLIALEKYRGISAHLDTAISYLLAQDVASLALGKHPVDGDDVFVVVSTYTTKAAEEAKFEAHRKYMDIQIVVQGTEHCGYVPLHGLEDAIPFDTEKDIGFFLEPSEGALALPLIPGNFAIFFPQDAHKPACDRDSHHEVKKVVVKVAV